MSSLFSLDGRVALVTGAANGIGAAIAEIFALSGASVIVADISASEGHATVDSIVAAGGQARFMPLDVASGEGWERIVDAIRSDFGALNILVNNAGIFEAKPTGETTFADWTRMVRVNQDSVFLGCKSCQHIIAESSKETSSGAIINLSSVAALVGVPFCAGYSATKGAVRFFTKSLALEYAQLGYNIRVNSLHPGLIDTRMGRTSAALVKGYGERTNASAIGIPMGRFGEAAELASAALFLASNAASYMTGAELVIDGGMTAQ